MSKVEKGRVYVTVSGLTGSGKSAVMGEIQIAMQAIGLTVEVEGDDLLAELSLYGDYESGLDLYKPVVVLREENLR